MPDTVDHAHRLRLRWGTTEGPVTGWVAGPSWGVVRNAQAFSAASISSTAARSARRAAMSATISRNRLSESG